VSCDIVAGYELRVTGMSFEIQVIKKDYFRLTTRNLIDSEL